ncbi:MAG TPA: class I SAM-dependent methyltransferase [Pseudonocardiaceae bacterium]|nr:class I SAM-dependent methyltransferase [Pseudonocardiaceae bacterium]
MAESPTRTALAASAARAAHLIVDGDPKIFEDTVALPLLGSDADDLIAFHRNSADAAFAAALRVIMTTRSRYVEDRLAEAAGNGINQYLILGAGLDSFAYRSPLVAMLRVFEVDHPDTQDWKRRRLAQARIRVPTQVAFVAVDFERDTLHDHLVNAGFEVNQPSFITWLGVSQYLSHAAIATTLSTLGGLAPGTELTVEYALPVELRDEAGRYLADQLIPLAAALGEPWLSFFSPTEMAALLDSCGFAVVEQVAQREQVNAALWRRSDGLRPSALSQLAQARVR